MVINKTKLSSIVVGSMVLAAVLAVPASARQLQILPPGDTARTAGDFEYKIGGCAYSGSWGGGSVTHSCTAEDHRHLVGLGGPSFAVEIERLVGGAATAPILQATGGASPKSNLAIQLNIKDVDDKTAETRDVQILARSITGPRVANDRTRVLATDTIKHSNGYNLPAMTANLVTPSVGQIFLRSHAFDGPFNSDLDLKINASPATHGSTLILSNVIQRFAPVPEPAAIGAFTVGLLGIGAIRTRRYIRRRRSA